MNLQNEQQKVYKENNNVMENNFYMVTETNLGLGQVPEIWTKIYQKSETAIDDIIHYLDETKQFYGRENDINNIKSELTEDGFTYLGYEEICFTVQKISL